MRLKLIYLGRKDDPWIEEGVAHYAGRIRHSTPFELIRVDLPKVSKSLNEKELQQKECEALERITGSLSHMIILDKLGRMTSSEELAKMIGRLQQSTSKAIGFVIGGPYGFTEAFRKKANAILALSEMTFPHQLARLVFTEQLYRAFTIIRGEKYHHP